MAAKKRPIIPMSGSITATGHLVIPYLNELQIRGAFLPFANKNVQVTIEELDETRKASLNRGYWGFMLKDIKAYIQGHWGETWSEKKIHTYHLLNILKLSPELMQFNGKEVIMFDPDQGTSSMNDDEFTQFLRDVQQHWSGFGCIVRDLEKQPNFAQNFLFPRTP